MFWISGTCRENASSTERIWKCESGRRRLQKSCVDADPANVLNIPIEKMEGMIGPAFGIALLSAYQGGSISFSGTDF